MPPTHNTLELYLKYTLGKAIQPKICNLVCNFIGIIKFPFDCERDFVFTSLRNKYQKKVISSLITNGNTSIFDTMCSSCQSNYAVNT